MKRISTGIIGLLLLGACASPPPEGTPFNDPENRLHVERVSPIDVLHYRIEARIDLREKSLDGTTTILFRPLRPVRKIELDAAQDISVREVRMGDRVLSTWHEDETLYIILPRETSSETSITISYTAKPSRGLNFVLPDEGYPDKPVMAWTQGETEYNHFWFPCYDYPNDRATTETIVTVPDPYEVISNGRLVEKKKKEGWTTWHWKQEVSHPVYLVSLAIGEFDTYADQWRGRPVTYHVPRGRYEEADVLRCLGMTPHMLEFFSKKIGIEYPYPKYAQTLVWDFIWGGMENTSATTLYQWAVSPEEGREGLIAHELAHQWFGDYLTCRTWGDIWLNESFATYFSWIWFEHRYGDDRMRREMNNGIGGLWNLEKKYRRPTVNPVYTLPMDVFDSYAYPRGAWVLHMLRDLLGDEAWWKGIRLYVKRWADSGVQTGDLLWAMEEAAGNDLDWFFDQWLYQVGHPEFTVSHEWREGKVILTVEQTQDPTRVRYPGGIVTGTPAVFRVPVEIGIGEMRHKVWIDDRRERFEFEVDDERPLLRFDVTGSILKKLTWKKSLEELILQLETDPEAVGRTWAADQLGAHGEPAVDALLRAVSDSFEGVAEKAVRSLGKIKTGDAGEGLRKILAAEKRLPVRKAIVQVFGGFAGNEEVRKILEDLMRSGKSRGIQSAAASSFGNFGESAGEALKNLLGEVKGDPFLVPGILTGLDRALGEEALPVLLEGVRYGEPPWVRSRALDLLCNRAKKEKDERAFRALLRLVHDPSMRLRRTAIRVLGELGDPSAVDVLNDRAGVEPDERVRKTIQTAVRKLTPLEVPATNP